MGAWQDFLEMSCMGGWPDFVEAFKGNQRGSFEMYHMDNCKKLTKCFAWDAGRRWCAFFSEMSFVDSRPDEAQTIYISGWRDFTELYETGIGHDFINVFCTGSQHYSVEMYYAGSWQTLLC